MPESDEEAGIIAFVLSLLGTGIIFLARKHIPENLLAVMKLTLKDVITAESRKAKKVKVNYPLFVKKSKANMFQRAVKEDFKRKKKKKAEKNKIPDIVLADQSSDQISNKPRNNRQAVRQTLQLTDHE